MSQAGANAMVLIWSAPLRFYSTGDEAAFFAWLQTVPGVRSVRGVGSALHIELRSKRISRIALHELIGLYCRYGGHLPELRQFANATNAAWFCNSTAHWHAAAFGA
jgi:hypothetical protein